VAYVEKIQKGKEVEDKMRTFANTYFGHDKAHAKMAMAEMKAATRPVKRVASDNITEEAMHELQEIQDLRMDRKPTSQTILDKKTGQGKTSTSKDGVKSSTGSSKHAQKSAKIIRRDERKELMKDVGMGKSAKPGEGKSLKSLQNRVNEFDQYFGHGQSHAALRKQLEEDADADASTNSKPSNADSDSKLAPASHLDFSTKPAAKASLHSAGDGQRLSTADKITEDAMNEFQKDKSLLRETDKSHNEDHAAIGATSMSDDRDTAASSSLSSQAQAATEPTRASSPVFGSTTDASARAWQPPKVDFAGLFSLSNRM